MTSATSFARKKTALLGQEYAQQEYALLGQDEHALLVEENMFFVDKDLDTSELGGPVTWKPPKSLFRVDRYSLYLARDPRGADRSELVDEVKAGDSSS